MRHAFRRVLWIIPSMVVISALTFWALVRTGPPRQSPEASLPLFFNGSPRDVRDRTLSATRRIARGESADGPAARELVRLGGAALPHVLPRLDNLAPDARVRVALALQPLARRMRIQDADALSDPERAVAFWTEFWQARAVDFRPAVVKRLVKRVGQRSSAARRDEIAELDTFALEELLAAMSPLSNDDDVQRVRAVAALAGDVTGLPWRVPEGAGVGAARDVASRWQRWWSRNRSSYVTFDGPRRLSAMLTETEYGHWAMNAVQSRLGTAASGRPVLDEFVERAPITLWLLLAGLTAGPIAGVLAALFAAAGRRGVAAAPSTLLALLSLSIPAATVAIWLRATSSAFAGSMAAACLAMAFVSFGLVYVQQSRRLCSALFSGSAVTLTAQGASPLRVARRQLSTGLLSVTSLLGAETPLLLTSAFVLEHGLELPGLGPPTLLAVRSGDDAWLMALALYCVCIAALVQIASDLLLAWLEPRRQEVGD